MLKSVATCLLEGSREWKPRAAKAHPLQPKNLANRHLRPKERALNARLIFEFEIEQDLFLIARHPAHDGEPHRSRGFERCGFLRLPMGGGGSGQTNGKGWWIARNCIPHEK